MDRTKAWKGLHGAKLVWILGTVSRCAHKDTRGFWRPSGGPRQVQRRNGSSEKSNPSRQPVSVRWTTLPSMPWRMVGWMPFSTASRPKLGASPVESSGTIQRSAPFRVKRSRHLPERGRRDRSHCQIALYHCQHFHSQSAPHHCQHCRYQCCQCRSAPHC